MPAARTSARRSFGRSRLGTSHTSSMALPAVRMTPIPPQMAPAIPTASATPLPSRDWTFSRIWSPITGNCARAESSTRSWSSGSPSSTRASTVVRASSSGNSDRNP